MEEKEKIVRMKEDIDYKEREQDFYKFIISEYLRYGSVDEVFRVNNYDLPISYPGIHHLLKRWGIIKAAGPNRSFAECISFLVRMAEEQIPLEALYKKMPPSFTPSMGTLHRMYRDVKKQVKSKIEERTPRRTGTALVITPRNNIRQMLIGVDISTPRLDLGKPFGSVSLPMGYSRKTEKPETSILRVLQQEVFKDHAVNQTMPDVIENAPEPFMFVDIVDVRVAAYHLGLPKDIRSFSSYKLKNHRLVHADQLAMSNMEGKVFRTGVVEIARGYKKYLGSLAKQRAAKPIYIDSVLNSKLQALYLESL